MEVSCVTPLPRDQPDTERWQELGIKIQEHAQRWAETDKYEVWRAQQLQDQQRGFGKQEV